MPGDRTEQATPHRREQARREGDILHSRELTAAAGTLAGALMLGAVGMRSVEVWRTSLPALLELGRPAHWEPATIGPTLLAIRSHLVEDLEPVALVMAAVVAAVLAVAIVQTGGVQVTPSALAFQIDRINPVSNLKNVFSLRGIARLAKSLIPAALLGVFAVQRIARELTIPPFSIYRLTELGHDVYGLVMAAAWLLFAWAAVDYIVEWRSRESRLRMSRDDLRQEHRQTEGNPEMRGRIRNLQRQMRRRRVREDVSKAAVVLTNPTHYAVALAFDFSSMETPRVVAKGRNLLAEEIKAEARWAGVPVVENPPLARSLYKSVEVGQPIPVDLYAAVASILAYLYRQRVAEQMREQRAREAARRSQSRTPQPPRNWQHPGADPGNSSRGDQP